ncbi:hypothetical protein [Flavobacterium sp. ABG]|uniref:hypothetical protein n=1 Tax=Flavobacterium sp. ABG TaxID=1423322 RepID=UPI00064B676E|nr:hypothetical protein [Flavobacterium sp. ABG]KLT69930.1 hypothetical protein AB674_09510 [Flavobacterium sp. ABG]
MKKFILCAFIAISALTSCSNDESEQAKTDNSFSYRITEVKAYDSGNNYVESGYDKNVNENSKIVYNESAKTISIIVSGTPQVFNIKSVINGVYTSSYKLPVSNGSPEVICKVEISFVNGNIIFLVTKPDTTFLAKIEYVIPPVSS